MRRSLCVGALVAICIGVLPRTATAQFDWVNKLFEKVEGVYLFAASPILAAMDSDPLVPDALHEYGFELVIDLFPADKPSGSSTPSPTTTYSSGQCVPALPLFAVNCTFQSGPMPRNVVTSSVSPVSVTRGKSANFTLVAFDANGRPSTTLVPDHQPVFRAVSANARVADASVTGAVVTVTAADTTGRTSVRACLDANRSSAAPRGYVAFAVNYCIDVPIVVTPVPSTRDYAVTVAVGYEFMSGFRARDASLDLVASVQTFPTFSIYVDPDLFLFYLGATVGLANLHNARALLPGSPPQSVTLEGQTLEVGFAVGLDFGPAFIEWAVRRREFRGVKWSAGGSEIAPPPNWFRSLDMTTMLVRVGIASSDVISALLGG